MHELKFLRPCVIHQALFTLSIDTLAGGTGQTCSLGEGLDATAFDLNSIGLPVSTHAADDWNPRT